MDQKNDSVDGSPAIWYWVEERKMMKPSAVVVLVPGLLGFGDCRMSLLAKN